MINDTQLTSYTHKNNADPKNGRLNNEKAWCSNRNSRGYEYFQIDLRKVRHVSAIATQGVKEGSHDNYVKEFLIKYSYDGVTWLFYKDQSGKRQVRDTVESGVYLAVFNTNFFYD